MFWPRGPQAGTVHGAICEISTDGATVPDCEVLGPVSQSHGRTTILRSSYDATFIFSRLSYDCFTKLVVKGS